MRIPGFSFFIKNHLQPHLLKDCSVVIDGHNLFYPMYKNSKLQFIFGPECDQYASYIRDQLEMFKKANLKCHFLIKGSYDSHENYDIHLSLNGRLHGDNFKLDQDYCEKIINPLLIKDTFINVLNEMGFEYSISFENDIVQECVALANKLSCPVISYNVQYCFYSAPYIPLLPGTQFDFDSNNSIKCGMYTRDSFLSQYNITENKLILFLLLSDIHIFDAKIFDGFLRVARIGFSPQKRYKVLLNWLRNKTLDQGIQEILKYLSESDKLKFSEEKVVLEKKLLSKEDNESIAVLFFTDKSKTKIDQFDPLWLEKGVCLNYVCLPYVHLYKFGIYKSTNLIEDFESNKSILLSADIIRYSYDLLTNFNGKEISIHTLNADGKEKLFACKSSISKPDYDAETCVFENGWYHIKSLRLFEHFLIESIQSFNFGGLEKVPADSRMLLIALVYFSRKKGDDVVSEVYSILLSYVMLSVVKENASANDVTNAITEQPMMDSTTDAASVTAQDCDIALSVMKDYFTITNYKLCDIFDRKILHPLVEFQHCLQHLNYLNTLSGTSFNQTIYSKTYNASFVYNILYEMKKSEKESLEFIVNLINPAATVLAFFKGLLETYESILYEY